MKTMPDWISPWGPSLRGMVCRAKAWPLRSISRSCEKPFSVSSYMRWMATRFAGEATSCILRPSIFSLVSPMVASSCCPSATR